MRNKGNKKGRQSARNKTRGVYVAQLKRTTATKHRHAIRRKNALAFFALHPDKGSPSQLRDRSHYKLAAIRRIKAKRKAGGKEAYEAFTGGSYEHHMANK